MKKLWVTGALLLSILTGCAAAQIPEPDSAIVQLRAPDGTAYCSGFVIDVTKQYIITADHCINGAFLPIIDGMPAFEFIHEPALDFAVLVAPGLDPKRRGLKPRTAPVAPDEPVVSTGYVREAFIQIRGFVIFPEMVAYDPTSGMAWGPIVLYYPQIVPGMSGGPILDKEGKVIAINQVTREDIAFSASTPMRVILEKIAKYWPTE